jgi:Streptomyces sporulation and cell division protein, SsgA
VSTVTGRILLCMTASDSAFFTADLFWDSEDPSTLSVTFHAANGDTKWVFARELVQRAYTFGGSGDGDVRIRKDGGYLILTLASPDGEAEARTDAGELANYMAKTYAVVPSSMESAAYEVQIDRALDHFFGQGA